ncbi:MAG: transcription antitermination factor NusB [Dongiaceae bacterium]
MKDETRPKSASPGFAVRAAAASLLAAVMVRGTSLDTALEADAAFAGLDTRDRALCRAIVGTALRRHGSIEEILATLIDRPPRHAGALFAILEVAAAQILFMGVADHAAVSVAVDQIAADRDARHFKGLANAVLRRMARERDALLAKLPPEIDTPAWLYDRWRAAYGAETTAAIAAAHRIEPALDVTVKDDPEGRAEKLGGIVLPTGTVRLIASGPIENLPGFAEGAWWVQDAAAALPARLLGDVRGKRVADLCAAPGGKTAQLAAAGALVTAVDISEPRLDRLRQNLRRLGLAAETVVADVLEWQLDAPFDAVLLDAPCTSTGTIRRHPDIPWLKRAGDVATLAILQARMIERASSFLRPGGTLVYCTCSLEPEEGEAQRATALQRLPLTPLPVAAAEIGGLAEALTAEGAVRTLPCHLPNADPRLSGLDGFYIARLGKA